MPTLSEVFSGRIVPDPAGRRVRASFDWKSKFESQNATSGANTSCNTTFSLRPSAPAGFYRRGHLAKSATCFPRSARATTLNIRPIRSASATTSSCRSRSNRGPVSAEDAPSIQRWSRRRENDKFATAVRAETTASNACVPSRGYRVTTRPIPSRDGTRFCYKCRANKPRDDTLTGRPLYRDTQDVNDRFAFMTADVI